VAAPLWALTQRFIFLFLLLAAGTVLLIGKADPQIFDRARIVVTDAFAPVLDAVSRPIATGTALYEEAEYLLRLRAENTALRATNARLLRWQAAARALATENAQLRDLLRFVPDPPVKYIAARIITDSGGTFVRTMLVNAGRRDGVRRDLPVVIGDGLIGRIVETGERVSRILLINDLNSRIPVTIGPDRERAVLAGDNTNQPKAIYLAANARVTTGVRIVTSGQGGVFPPGLPVGIVASTGADGVRVETFVQTDRLDYVRILDFGLAGVLDGDRRQAGAE
jgi:rod shape-determining protein MreC